MKTKDELMKDICLLDKENKLLIDEIENLKMIARMNKAGIDDMRKTINDKTNEIDALQNALKKTEPRFVIKSSHQLVIERKDGDIYITATDNDWVG